MKTEDNRKVARILAGLRKTEPVLKNPDELTDQIMLAIRPQDRETSGRPGKIKSNPGTLRVISRLLAAASLFLLALFTHEQYQVVEKIVALERQNDSISHYNQYQPALQLNKIADIFSSHPELADPYTDYQNGKINTLKLVKAVIISDLFARHQKGYKKDISRKFNENNHPFNFLKKEPDSTFKLLNR